VASVLNPTLIIIGGTLAQADEHLLAGVRIAGVRERVYQRCLPLATRELRISLACSDDRAALLGTAELVVELGRTNDSQSPRRGASALLERDPKSGHHFSEKSSVKTRG